MLADCPAQTGCISEPCSCLDISDSQTEKVGAFQSPQLSVLVGICSALNSDLCMWMASCSALWDIDRPDSSPPQQRLLHWLTIWDTGHYYFNSLSLKFGLKTNIGLAYSV